MDDVASATASKLHQCPKEKSALSGTFVEEKEVQQRAITLFQPEEVGGPPREYKASVVALNFIECSNSGTFKAAASSGLERLAVHQPSQAVLKITYCIRGGRCFLRKPSLVTNLSETCLGIPSSFQRAKL